MTARRYALRITVGLFMALAFLSGFAGSAKALLGIPLGPLAPVIAPLPIVGPLLAPPTTAPPTTTTSTTSTSVVVTTTTTIPSGGAVRHCGTLPEDQTWPKGPLHIVDCSLTVPEGVTLRLAPGARVKFGSEFVTIRGALVSEGTESEPVVLTSITDNTVGGDTFPSDDGNSEPSMFQWRLDQLYAEVKFVHTNLRYSWIVGGYYGSVPTPADRGVAELRDSTAFASTLEFSFADATIKNNDFSWSSLTLGRNVHVDVQGNDFMHSGTRPASAPAAAALTAYKVDGLEGIGPNESSGPDRSHRTLAITGGEVRDDWIMGNGFDHTSLDTERLNIVSGETVVDDTLLAASSGIDIAQGATLRFSPGAKAKFLSWVTPRGSFIAEGTESEPVVLTTLADNTVGGDTYPNDDSLPEPDLFKWQFEPAYGAGTRIVLDHTDLRYAFFSGGYYASESPPSQRGSVVMRDSSVLASNVTFAWSEATIRDNDFSWSVLGLARNRKVDVEGNVFRHDGTMPPLASDGGAALGAYKVDGLDGIGRNESSGPKGEHRTMVVTGGTVAGDWIMGDGFDHTTLQGQDGVKIASGTTTVSDSIVSAWTGIQVDPAATLRFDPGARAKLSSWVTVAGSFVSAGTPAAPVDLTTLTDNTIGGDTYPNDDSSPEPDLSVWRLEPIYNSGSVISVTNTRLRYAAFSGGYYQSNPRPEHPGSVVLRDSTVQSSQLTFAWSDATVRDNDFSWSVLSLVRNQQIDVAGNDFRHDGPIPLLGVDVAPLQLRSVDGLEGLGRNALSGGSQEARTARVFGGTARADWLVEAGPIVEITGGELDDAPVTVTNGAQMVTTPGSVIILSGGSSLSVEDGGELFVSDGSTIKGFPGANIDIRSGWLRGTGTLTSWRDNTGGDTNPNDDNAAETGDWRGLDFGGLGRADFGGDLKFSQRGIAFGFGDYGRLVFTGNFVSNAVAFTAPDLPPFTPDCVAPPVQANAIFANPSPGWGLSADVVEFIATQNEAKQAQGFLDYADWLYHMAEDERESTGSAGPWARSSQAWNDAVAEFADAAHNVEVGQNLLPLQFWNCFEVQIPWIPVAVDPTDMFWSRPTN